MEFKKSHSGFYVAIEGIDTCGKSTQITNLMAYYPHAIFSKEPGASALGAKIRGIVLNDTIDSVAEFFLFLSDRAQHYAEVLKPHLDSHKLVITDRSLLSGMAYAKDIDEKLLLACNQLAMRALKPHLCILLELDKKNLEARLSAKANDNIEKRGFGYMLEIQERLARYASLLGVDMVKIDASLPIPTITKCITSSIGKLFYKA